MSSSLQATDLVKRFGSKEAVRDTQIHMRRPPGWVQFHTALPYLDGLVTTTQERVEPGVRQCD